MADQHPQAAPHAGTGYKDRKTGLLVGGILLIVMGGFCILGVFGMLFTIIVASSGAFELPPGQSPAAMAPGILVYVAGAAWFIVLGVGSVRARRWARALVVLSTSILLTSAVIAMPMMLRIMPQAMGAAMQGEEVPHAATAAGRQ